MAIIDYLPDPIVFSRMNVQKLLILLFQILNPPPPQNLDLQFDLHVKNLDWVVPETPPPIWRNPDLTGFSLMTASLRLSVQLCRPNGSAVFPLYIIELCSFLSPKWKGFQGSPSLLDPALPSIGGPYGHAVQFVWWVGL